MMKIFVVTLFPEVMEPYLQSSIMKKAVKLGAVSFELIPLRNFGIGKHHQVDDAPYGGGAGMVLMPQPVFAAVDSVVEREKKKPHTVLLTPQGKRFTHQDAQRLSRLDSLLLLCGRYEGVDERIRERLADEEISIGDYVLTGGELPALVVMDACTRLREGVLPKESVENESYAQNLLEYPQYTRPVEFQGMQVPPVLLQGNHAEIERWRRQNAIRRTVSRSKELLEQANLTEEEKKWASRFSQSSQGENHELDGSGRKTSVAKEIS